MLHVDASDVLPEHDRDTPADSIHAVAQAFSDRINELKQYTYLRIDDTAKQVYEQDLAGLEASVRALETHVAELKRFLRQEANALPKVEALLEACRLQSDDLQSITTQTAPLLPTGTMPTASDAAASSGPAAAAARSMPPQAGEDERRRREAVLRRYVSEPELQSVSSYMRGRLTLEKVNAAVDEMAVHAEANVKLMAAIKSRSSSLPPAERKRGTEILHAITGKDNIKGRYWFLETDLKDGNFLKPDKTGRAILTLLRHLSRVQEVRITVEGSSNNLYILT